MLVCDITATFFCKIGESAILYLHILQFSQKRVLVFSLNSLYQRPIKCLLISDRSYT